MENQWCLDAVRDPNLVIGEIFNRLCQRMTAGLVTVVNLDVGSMDGATMVTDKVAGVATTETMHLTTK